jgi:hypothetical protein
VVWNCVAQLNTVLVSIDVAVLLFSVKTWTCMFLYATSAFGVILKELCNKVVRIAAKEMKQKNFIRLRFEDDHTLFRISFLSSEVR